MSSVGFEPANPVIKWLQTNILDRTANGIGTCVITSHTVLHFKDEYPVVYFVAICHSAMHVYTRNCWLFFVF
jgi:hypothetical protein